jgi:tetratricopeptide (TPR) repeat protein
VKALAAQLAAILFGIPPFGEVAMTPHFRLLLQLGVVLGSVSASFADNLNHAIDQCTKSKIPAEKIEQCTVVIHRSDDRGILERAFNRRGHARFAMNQFIESVNDFTEAIRLNPRIAGYYDNRQNAYKAIGRLRDALNDANTAVHLAPNYAFVYQGRASVYDAMGHFDLAINDYSKCISLEPINAFHFFYRGTLLAKNGQLREALADLTQALAIDRNLVDAYRERGFTYKKLENSDAAKSDLTLFAAVRSDDVEVAQALRELQSPPASIQHYVAPANAAAPPTPAPVAWTVPVAATALQSGCDKRTRRVALIVGNGAYNVASKLPNPTNDADDVAEILRSKLCFDTLAVKDATRAAFEQAVGVFVQKAENAEIALFYYAGHAMQLRQTNFLLPVDSDLSNEYGATHSNISAQDLITTLESRAKVTLVFLDACRNNPLEEEFRRRVSALGRGFDEQRGLAPMSGHHSETLIVFATRPNEQAADGTGRNSPFTRAFLEHIATPNRDVELVMRDVAASVRQQTNGRQIPQRLTELQNGLVLLKASDESARGAAP